MSGVKGMHKPGGQRKTQKLKGVGLYTDRYEVQTDEDKRKEENVIEWTTLFRRNWHIYAEYVLGIKLKPFQRIMLWIAGSSEVFFAICSRGLSKSFMAGLMALIQCLLYPYSEIIITSSTVAQSNRLFENKIRDELVLKLSPYLRDMYERKYLLITRQDDGYMLENTLNGSKIKVLACTESARGERSCLTIYEECRLLKKGMIDSVFEKMAHPRQAKYVVNSDSPYSKDPRWLEECKSVYITSARYSFEWFWNTFKDCVTGYYTDNKTRYNVFAGDIFLAIENNLKTWGDFRKAKKMSGEFDFRMEDLNEMLGEADDAFFSIKEFAENRTIEKCWRPPTVADLYLGRDIGNIPKEKNEVRLIVADFAFANTIGYKDNDNTMILCMSLHWMRNHFERHLDYIEGHEASDSLGAADRIRALRVDYQADYCVIDGRSGGETLFNYMTEPKDDPNRGSHWEGHGLGLSDKYQQVTQEKINDYIHRTVDREPIRCLIPVTSSLELNSRMWLELKKHLSMGNIKFCQSMQDHQATIEDNGLYYNLTAEELATEMLPYGQTDELIQEAVNLKAEFRQDKLKLTEPRTGTKDRAVCLSYGNWIASQIENDWLKQQQEAQFDVADWTLVW